MRATMSSHEARGGAPRAQATEQRRFSRDVRPWSIVLETRYGVLRLQLIDLSPGGAKIRLTERVSEGTKGRLYFLPPYWRPRAIDAVVWRIDLDGVVLRFSTPSIAPLRAAHDSWLSAWENSTPES